VLAIWFMRLYSSYKLVKKSNNVHSYMHMTFLKLFTRGNFGVLKTFIFSHIALILFVVIAQLITNQLPQRRGELENSYVVLYFLLALELLGIYLLYSFWNAIKNYNGKKVWILISKSYAFFVLQCLMAPLYFIGYLYYQ